VNELLGLHIEKVHHNCGADLLQSIEYELEVLRSVAWNVEDIRPTDKDGIVILLQRPLHLEALSDLQPILDRKDLNGGLLSLDSDVERLGEARRRGDADQVVEQGGAVRQWEEDRPLMLAVCNAGEVWLRCHRQRLVGDFILRRAVSGQLEHRLPFEKVFPSAVIDVDRDIYLARLRCWVLDYHLLLCLAPDNRAELEHLNRLLGLGHTLAEEVDEERVVALDVAAHLVEANIIVDNVRVESDVETDVFVRGQVAALWIKREVPRAEVECPGKLYSDVAEVGEVELAHLLRVDLHDAEPDGVLHQLELDALAGCEDIEKLPLFLVLDNLV